MRTVLACLLLLFPALAFAWDGSPRLIEGATDTPALVATAHDGAYGAFVAWQVPSTAAVGANTLHLTRLTADGDPHVGWPAGGLVLGGVGVRTALRLLPDNAGGVYAWWVQGGTLRITRILGNGAIASGWTVGGKSLGTLTGADYRPWVEPDGAGGVWIGRFQGIRSMVINPSVTIGHYGPDGQGAGGWPTAMRAVPLADSEDEWVYSASFAPAQDGGAWVLVATGHETESGITPGEWRLARFTSAGELDPAFPPQGAVLEPFEADQIGPYIPRLGIGAVLADDAGGTFVALGRVTAGAPGEWQAYAQLQRRLADGSMHPQQPGSASQGGWSEQAGGTCAYVPCAWADYSVRLMRDAAGTPVMAATSSYTHVGFVLGLYELSAAGTPVGQIAGASGAGIALHPAFNSGFVISSFDPEGPTHAIYDPGYAYVGYSETGKSGSYAEETFSPYSPVYTGSDVASLPDGGALLVWARAQSPTGLYALRVGANGSPLAVGPGPGAPSRGLRLLGRGADLRAEWDAGAAGTLTLHDVAGRERARLSIAAGAGAAMLTPGEPLAPGVYFGRLARADGSFERARAVVLR
jgi:hypothetical protein